jgi:hypothetical protein
MDAGGGRSVELALMAKLLDALPPSARLIERTNLEAGAVFAGARGAAMPADLQHGRCR